MGHDYWRFFAEHAEDANSPLYAYLARRIGADDDLKALAARAKKGQPHANMIFGAVHFLLLRGAQHPLKDFYATLGGTRTLSDGEPFSLFADFVARHRDAIARLIETRVTNTNEVARSAVLHPGFRATAAKAGAPLALIEIGPSAGLNMIWDRYGVRYMKDGRAALALAPDAPLVIDCELRGERLPPSGPVPAVASRVGLERDPNNLSDPDDRDWLRALVWPEHVDRLKRLETAMALTLAEKPAILAGDALELLLAAIGNAPQAAAVCVYHTIVLYQFSREMKASLDDLLTVAGLRRPVFHLGFEMAPDQRYLLTLRSHRDGVTDEAILAESHPHGRWLEWLA